MSRKIEGHTDAVLCCTVLPARKLLASGGEDGRLCLTDLTTLSGVGVVRQSHGDAVTAVCSTAASEHLLYASAGQAMLALDLRKGLSEEAVCDTWELNQDEVNHIAVNRQGSWLAAGDDSGEVQLINLQQPRDGAGRPGYKTLRRGHSNICSAVAFRPHRPWEVLSGGLDSTVVRWDFSRLRPQQSWNLGSEAAASGGQVFNPPMVHSVVVPDTEDRSLCRLMAVGRGDGYVSLYDIDSKPTLPSGLGGSSSSSSDSSGSKKGGAAGRQRGGGGSAGKGAAGQRGASSSSGAGGTEAAAEAPASEGEAATAAVAAAEDPWRVPFVPGRLCLLGREQGGHTAAVNCLTFLHGSSWQRLLSAGNEGRLVLWNWPAAAAKQAAAWGLAAGAGKGPSEPAAAASQGEEQEGCGSEGEAAAAAAVEGAAASTAAEDAAVLAADIRHGRKINWVCTCEPVGAYNVFVADVTRRLTALALQ